MGGAILQFGTCVDVQHLCQPSASRAADPSAAPGAGTAAVGQRASSRPAADIILSWNPPKTASKDRVAVLREAVAPVCSPAYAAEHGETLAGPGVDWSGLTLLDLVRPNPGWTSWDDWLALPGRPAGTPRRLEFDHYTYVLEAAAAGNGIALGCRDFIERLLDAGALVLLGDGLVETGCTLYGVLTEKGSNKPLARQCLRFLGLD